jgi:hypothetical protein
MRHGRKIYMPKNFRKLTSEDVLEIRRKHIPGTAGIKGSGNVKSLMSEFGVTKQQILAIIHRTQWAHI